MRDLDRSALYPTPRGHHSGVVILVVTLALILTRPRNVSEALPALFAILTNALIFVWLFRSEIRGAYTQVNESFVAENRRFSASQPAR